METKKPILILGILAVVIGAGCIGGEKSLTPSETVKAYAKAMQEGDAEKTVSYLSSEAKDGIEKQSGEKAIDLFKKAFENQKLPDTGFEIIKEEINGNKAVVVVKSYSSSGGNKKTATIGLIKEEGVWKIGLLPGQRAIGSS